MKPKARNNLILFLEMMLLLGLATATFATIPKRMNYQGRLVDSNNNPRNGVFTMTFSIWDEGPGVGAGTQLWSGTQDVTVTNGVFSTQLGKNTPLPPEIFTGATTYLQIQIGAEVASSRQRLVSSPYAFRAAIADDVEAGDEDYIQNSSTLQADSYFHVTSGTVAGNLSVAGAIRSGSSDVVIADASGNLTASRLSGTVPNTTLDGSSVTLQGNTFNAANRLVKLDGSNGLTLSGTLTFSGVSGDITTGTGEHLSLTPGAGGNVGIGTNTPTGQLQVLKPNAGASDKLLVVSSGAAAGQDVLTVLGDGSVSVAGPLKLQNQVAQIWDNTGGVALNDTFTVIPWDSVTVIDPIFSHSTSVNPHLLTVNQSGLYRVTYHINTDVPSGNTRTSCEVVALKNGTAITPSTTYTYNRQSTDGVFSAEANFLVSLTNGETLEVRAKRRTGGVVNVIAGSWMLVELIR